MATSDDRSIPDIPKEKVLVVRNSDNTERFIIGKAATNTGYKVIVQRRMMKRRYAGYRTTREKEASKGYILDLLATYEWERVHANTVDLRQFVTSQGTQSSQ